MSVSIATHVSIRDLEESFKAPFRENDLRTLPHELDTLPCTTEEEYEEAIRDAGRLIDRLTLIEKDMAARYDLLIRHTGSKRIDGYREFVTKVRTLRMIAGTAVYNLQTYHIAERMVSGLSPRSIAPATFPAALTMGSRTLPLRSPDLLTLSEVSSILGVDEMILNVLVTLGDIPSDRIDGEPTFMLKALEYWLNHAKPERMKRL